MRKRYANVEGGSVGSIDGYDSESHLGKSGVSLGCRALFARMGIRRCFVLVTLIGITCLIMFISAQSDFTMDYSVSVHLRTRPPSWSHTKKSVADREVRISQETNINNEHPVLGKVWRIPKQQFSVQTEMVSLPPVTRKPRSGDEHGAAGSQIEEDDNDDSIVVDKQELVEVYRTRSSFISLAAQIIQRDILMRLNRKRSLEREEYVDNTELQADEQLSVDLAYRCSLSNETDSKICEDRLESLRYVVADRKRDTRSTAGDGPVRPFKLFPMTASVPGAQTMSESKEDNHFLLGSNPTILHEIPARFAAMKNKAISQGLDRRLGTKNSSAVAEAVNGALSIDTAAKQNANSDSVEGRDDCGALLPPIPSGNDKSSHGSLSTDDHIIPLVHVTSASFILKWIGRTMKAAKEPFTTQDNNSSTLSMDSVEAVEGVKAWSRYWLPRSGEIVYFIMDNKLLYLQKHYPVLYSNFEPIASILGAGIARGCSLMPIMASAVPPKSMKKWMPWNKVLDRSSRSTASKSEQETSAPITEYYYFSPPPHSQTKQRASNRKTNQEKNADTLDSRDRQDSLIIGYTSNNTPSGESEVSGKRLRRKQSHILSEVLGAMVVRAECDNIHATPHSTLTSWNTTCTATGGISGVSSSPEPGHRIETLPTTAMTAASDANNPYSLPIRCEAGISGAGAAHSAPSTGLVLSSVVKYGTKTAAFRGTLRNLPVFVKVFHPLQYQQFRGFHALMRGSNKRTDDETVRDAVSGKALAGKETTKESSFIGPARSKISSRSAHSPLVVYPYASCYSTKHDAVFQVQELLDGGMNLHQFIRQRKQQPQNNLAFTTRQKLEIALQIACTFLFFHSHPSGWYTYDDNHPEQYYILPNSIKPAGNESSQEPLYTVRLIDIDTIQRGRRIQADGTTMEAAATTSSARHWDSPEVALQRRGEDYAVQCRCFHCHGKSNCIFFNTPEGYVGCKQDSTPQLWNKDPSTPATGEVDRATAATGEWQCRGTTDMWFEAQVFYYIFSESIAWKAVTDRTELLGKLNSLAKDAGSDMKAFPNMAAIAAIDPSIAQLIRTMFAERPHESVVLEQLGKLCVKYQCRIGPECPVQSENSVHDYTSFSNLL